MFVGRVRSRKHTRENEEVFFQGESLCPLLFCLCVAPLGCIREAKGFRAIHKRDPTTHLMFVDDLKVYVEDKVGLEEVDRMVEDVSGAMGT